MDIRKYNRDAWNRLVANNNRWTIPVSAETIRRAAHGDWQIILTPTKPVPGDWFPDLPGCDTLCLAAGGGQQAPILAAAGANVVVVDNSPDQLRQDRLVADRDGLQLVTVESDMRDLSSLADEQFDLVIHPCSNSFVPDVLQVWSEAYRVLRPGGILLSGFCNPIMFIFDYPSYKKGKFVVRHRVPYSDLQDLSTTERDRLMADGEPLAFGHTLDDQIGGQIQAGFSITGFYEDTWGDSEEEPLDRYLPCFIATRAGKPT
jgi:SAM-dependent methyltransferase